MAAVLKKTLFLMMLVLAVMVKTQAQITSTFDADDEGWTAIDNQSGPTPTYFATGGNPGGFIQVRDGVGGTATYFVAPEKFLGNLSAYYGGTLRFDLQVYITPNSNTAGVRLLGGGLILVKLIPQLPAVSPAWSSYSFTLSEADEWRLTSSTGSIATQSDIQTVLESLTALQINGEYSTSAGDEGSLDNVIMTPASLPEIVVYNALSPNDDLLNDFWIIENIAVRDDTRENTVKILNRWGDVVWECTNYDNTTMVFTGIDKNGKRLLPGTYFYRIDFLSNRKQEAGFISLKY
jgi:gliding motility-associated-like protein